MNEEQETTAAQETPDKGKTTRRRFLRIGGGAAVVALAGGVVWLGSGPGDKPIALANAIATVDRLSERLPLVATGEWTPYRILSHVAQSIEMSMSGYPQHESPLYKNTLGATAYSFFRKRGRMSHDLGEFIPGAPLIDEDGETADALQRLRRALLDFDGFEGDLAPHFAYGALSKSQYAAAHVMHFNNHLIEIANAQT